MTDYSEKYRRLLRKTIKGIRRRGFWFGYASDRLKAYISRQRRKINWLVMDAEEDGQRIHSKSNLEIDCELFGLEIKAEMSRAGIPV